MSVMVTDADDDDADDDDADDDDYDDFLAGITGALGTCRDDDE